MAAANRPPLGEEERYVTGRARKKYGRYVRSARGIRTHIYAIARGRWGVPVEGSGRGSAFWKLRLSVLRERERERDELADEVQCRR